MIIDTFAAVAIQTISARRRNRGTKPGLIRITILFMSIILFVQFGLAAITKAQLPPPPPPEPALNNPPSSPQLVSPAHNQNDLATTLAFSWEKSSDPDGDTVSYDFHACEDIDFKNGCISETGIAGLTDKGIYYAGIDGDGTGLLLLAGFMLITGIPLDKQKVSFLISLLVITGMLLISCGSGGGGSSGGSITENTGATSNEVSQTVSLKDGTTYYWKVVAKDDKGGASDSEVRDFATK